MERTVVNPKYKDRNEKKQAIERLCIFSVTTALSILHAFCVFKLFFELHDLDMQILQLHTKRLHHPFLKVSNIICRNVYTE